MTNSMGDHTPTTERLLTGGEVAELFRVDARTVGDWRRAGRLDAVRTPGGSFRYRESAVNALLCEGVSA